MPWNSVWPVGTTSVRVNRPTGQQNTAYVEATLNKDHFFNIGVNEDGHHSQVQMPTTTLNKIVAAGMAGVTWYRQVAVNNARTEIFYTNLNNTYQVSPSFVTGVINIPSTSTFTDILSLPDQTYGEIYIWLDGGAGPALTHAFFVANNNTMQAYSGLTLINNASGTIIEFANSGTAIVNNLNLRAKRSLGPSADYKYQLTWRSFT